MTESRVCTRSRRLQRCSPPSSNGGKGWATGAFVSKMVLPLGPYSCPFEMRHDHGVERGLKVSAVAIAPEVRRLVSVIGLQVGDAYPFGFPPFGSGGFAPRKAAWQHASLDPQYR